MSDQGRRLTAAELKAQQEERENREAEQGAAQAKQAADLRQQRDAEEQRAVFQNIKATWYESAKAAADRPGVRFCVLAQVTEPRHIMNLLTELMVDAKSSGYTMTLVGQLGEVAHPARVGQRGELQGQTAAKDAGQEVSDGTSKGWSPGSVPRLGQGGHVQWLIVGWA